MEISKGSQEPEIISKDVVIDLRGSALELECSVTVLRDGVAVYSAVAPAGTASIVIPGQTGSGVVVYQVVINEQDGWDVVEEFAADG